MLFAIPNQRRNVIPIRPDFRMSNSQQQIADLAYEFWLARCFRRNGSPEQSYLQAVLEVTLRQGNQATPVGMEFKTGIRGAAVSADCISDLPPEAA
jgi:hypothetical protein